MKHLITACSLALLTSSCAFHQGQLSVDNTHQTTHSFQTLAVGTAKTGYFLGIGGHSSDALVLQAKNQLYKNFPLRENEVYGTFSVDIKRSYFFLYAQTQVLVSADILAPNNGQTSAPLDTGLAATRARLYVEGTKRKAIPVQVLKDQGNGTCQTISFSDGDVQLKNRYKRDLLYPFAHPVNAQKQHMLEQIVNFRSAYYKKGSAAKGKILAAGRDTFLVEVLDTKEQFILYPWEFYTD